MSMRSIAVVLYGMIAVVLGGVGCDTPDEEVGQSARAVLGCDASSPQQLTVCPTCTLKTLFDAQVEIRTREGCPASGACSVGRPYAVSLVGTVKVGCDDRAAGADQALCGPGGLWWTVSGSDAGGGSGSTAGPGGASCPIVIAAANPSDKPTLLRNTPQNNHAWYMLVLQGVSYVTLRDLKVPDAGAGLGISNSSHCSIERCELTIGDFDVEGGAGAIYVGAGENDDDPTQAHYNAIIDNTITFTSEAPMDVDWRMDQEDFASDAPWRRYSLYHGVYLAHADHTLVSGNSIVNAPGGAIHSYHNWTTYSTIANNTIYRCNTHDYPILDGRDPAIGGAIDAQRWGIILSGATNVFGNSITGNRFYVDRKVTASPSSYDAPLGSTDLFVIKPDYGAGNRWGNTFSANKASYGSSYVVCAVNGAAAYAGRYAQRYTRPGVEVFRFVPGEIFVVLKDIGRVIKIAGTGGTGKNMFALDAASGGLPGYSYWLGTHVFDEPITAMTHQNGYTFIGFASGRLLKVSGTGGTGAQMFGVVADGAGFHGDGSANAASYAGSHKFLNGVRHLRAVGGFLFLSFTDGKLLKVNGAGGGGYNLFAISETSTAFNNVPGYGYYAGDDRFWGKTTALESLGGELFVAFDNGKLLKIHGAGGTGHWMFAVTESAGGFAPMLQANDQPYPYYAGYQTFVANVPRVLALVGSDLFVGFTTGRVLKIAGIGSTGANMFCVAEDGVGAFSATGGCAGGSPYRGDETFAWNGRPVTAILGANGYTFVGYEDGTILKAAGTGGSSGHHIFAGAGKYYLRTAVSALAYIDGQLIISTVNRNVLKIAGVGGGGGNFFAVFRDGADFSSSWNPQAHAFYSYLMGTQLF